MGSHAHAPPDWEELQPQQSLVGDKESVILEAAGTTCSGELASPAVVSEPESLQPQNRKEEDMINFAHFYPVVSGGGRILTAPRPLVICGPSGSGKSTLLKKLLAEFGEYFGFSVSHTTRKPREGEVDGREYHFTDREWMLQAIENGEFIESTQFSGNIYGTSKKSVRDVQDKGRICILDVEIEGVKNLKKTDLNPRFVFVKPPSLPALEQRLRTRGTESEAAVAERLKRARDELEYGELPGNFDIVLVNDDVEEAYSNLRSFVIRDVEELKQSRGM